MKKILLFLSFLSFMVSAHAQTPTWSENVACIVYTHCTKCHNPAGIAPTSLLTYTEAVARASEMKTQVRSGAMPPWKANRSYSHFTHERYLTSSEIDIISRWVDGGMPEGNPSHAPVAPVYTTSADITSPDLTAKMTPFLVPASTTVDLYRCFVMHPSFSGSPTIIGIEGLPGNSAIVHHMLIYQDTTNVPDTLDAHDPGVGYTFFSGCGSPSAILIGTWAPGSGAYFFPENMGIKLLPHAKIVIQVHYPTAGAGQADSSKVLFKLSSDTSIRQVSIYPFLNALHTMTDGPLFIPADTARYFHEMFSVPYDMTVLSIFPHMHLIGRSMKLYAIKPTFDTIPLVDVPSWDFHWQGFYNFTKPVFIPAGSRLFASAFYDNTSANPENPSSPPRNVTGGDATTDEMMLNYFAFLPYESEDESIIIDTSSSIPTYLGCSYSGVGISTLSSPQIRVYPNPTSMEIELQMNDQVNGHLQILNALGEVVFEENKVENDVSIDVHSWSAGIYQVVLSSPDRHYTTKFIKQ